MALEGLGKSAADYGGNRDTLLAVATYFRSKLGRKADLQGHSDGTSWGDVAALRLPDFMELAAISQCLAATAKKNKTSEKTDNASILAAAREAWPKIKSIDFLATLARSFGATAAVRNFSFDPHAPAKKGHEAQDNPNKDSEHLGGQTKDTRKEIDKLIDARNRAEMATDPAQKAKLQKAYEDQKAKDEKTLTGSKIEKDVPLERYKQAVKDTLGAELAAGAAIETHVIGHFVRLRAIHDDHVVIDDPGQWARAHKTVLWEEARAQGMFERRLVIT